MVNYAYTCFRSTIQTSLDLVLTYPYGMTYIYRARFSCVKRHYFVYVRLVVFFQRMKLLSGNV